jgi:hypothetical protein
MNEFTALREMKAQQIEDYFLFVRNQVNIFSRSTMVLDAMR